MTAVNTNEAAGDRGTGTAAAPVPGAAAAPAAQPEDPPRGPRRREALKLLLVGGAAATAATAATSAGFYLAGKSPDTGDASVDPDARLITWAASSIDQNPIDTRPALVDEFERANPTIKVTLLPGPSNTDAKRDALTAAIKDGSNAPDVYLGDVIWPAEFGYEELAMPLDDLLPDSFWTRFEQKLLVPASYNGRRYSVPFYASQGVLFYRKDLLNQYEKSVPKTWEELATTAEEIVNSGDEDAPPYGFIWQGDAYEGLTCVWTEFVADAGGAPDPLTARSLVDSPGAQKALKFLRDLIQKGITPREVTAFQEPQATALFNDRSVIFMRGWNTADTHIEDDDTIGVAPLPTFSGRPLVGYSTIGGWNLFVNPNTNTRKHDAARTFIDWMTGEQAQRILARYAQIPTINNVRNDSDVAPDNEVLQIAQKARPVARPSNTPLYPEISNAIYTNLNRALADDKVTPESALAAAATEINAILSD